MSKKPQQLTVEQTIDSVPVRNREVVTEKTADGGMLLAVPLQPRKTIPVFGRKPRATHYRRKLDRLGAIVWDRIDDSSTMEAIIQTFSQDYRISFHEARIAVMQFITMLTRIGAVRMTRKHAPDTSV